MQRIAVFIALLLAPALQAATEFVSPASGAQALGMQPIEVRTDATSINRVEFFVDGVLAGVARNAPWRIAYEFGLSPAARSIEAKVWSDSFKSVERARTTTAAIASGETLTVDLVEVPVRVRASRRLTAKDIRIRENGKEQVVRELLPQRGPAHFAFVVDRSMSMGGGRLDASLRAIDAARRMLRAGDSASLLLFNHNVAKRATLAPSDVVAKLVGDVVPSGGTSLRDALASLPIGDRTYAIVISDGGDRNSAISEEEALRAIGGTRSVVDAVVFGTPSRFLERAASNTGGSVVRASSDTIQSRLEQVMADINGRYVAVYQSSGGARGWRSIAVSARNARVQLMNARKGYFAR